MVAAIFAGSFGFVATTLPHPPASLQIALHHLESVVWTPLLKILGVGYVGIFADFAKCSF